jgi:hypothetical protein
MDHLIECVRKAVRDRNRYAGLGMALALPDICGKLENPTSGSRIRYVSWFDANFRWSYVYEVVAATQGRRAAELMARGLTDRAREMAERQAESLRDALRARIGALSVSLDGKPLLTGSDCYALRCAYLHEGEMDITSQSAQMILDKFAFTEPRPPDLLHGGRFNNLLQLQVDIFCEDVCRAVEDWLSGVAGNPDIQARIAALPKIHEAGKPLLF